MQSQFFAASFSIAINNRANNKVQFQDLNVNNIIFVTAKTWVNDSTGVNTPVYEVQYQETNAIDLTTYLFPRSTGQTVGQFAAIINAWAPANNLTYYTGWFQINLRDIGTARPVLINDDFVTRRVYLTLNGGQTRISVGYRQELYDTIFTLQGNQTKAVTYYYSYTWAG